jgi:Family of unknown function (DUF6812)
MEMGKGTEPRIERIQVETDRDIIVGNITLPPEGHQSRISDWLNRPEISFLPMVDVEITRIGGDSPTRRDFKMVRQRDFVVVRKEHVRIAFPIEEVS